MNDTQKIVVGINALIALTELSEHLSAAISSAAAKIREAQSEGRDLTDDELDQIDKAREAAMAKWNARNDPDPSGESSDAS